MIHAIKLQWRRTCQDELHLRLGKAAHVTFKQNRRTKKWTAHEFQVGAKFERAQLERDALRPIVSILNGALILHAALVRKKARGHLVFADSGSGKSTLTAHLMKNGWEAHSDDMSKIFLSGGSARASGVRKSVVLDRNSYRILGLGAFVSKDRKVSKTLKTRTKVVPLTSILILKKSNRFRVRPASSTEAMSYLLKGSWRPPLRIDPNFTRFLYQVAKLVEMIPCEVVEYPKHKSSLARVQKHLAKK